MADDRLRDSAQAVVDAWTAWMIGSGNPPYTTVRDAVDDLERALAAPAPALDALAEVGRLSIEWLRATGTPDARESAAYRAWLHAAEAVITSRDVPGDEGKDERAWKTRAASPSSTTTTHSPESGEARQSPDSTARTPEPSSSRSSRPGSTASGAGGSGTSPSSETGGGATSGLAAPAPALDPRIAAFVQHRLGLYVLAAEKVGGVDPMSVIRDRDPYLADAIDAAKGLAAPAPALDAAVMAVVLDFARETLHQHDRMKASGWVMTEIPHEAEVRAALAAPLLDYRAEAARSLSERGHGNDLTPEEG